MKPIVRILIVTDDGFTNGGFLLWQDQSMPAAIGANSREFHLGEFIRVLQDTTWLGFNIEITKAHRSLPGTGGMNEAQLKADRGADVVGFRFNQPFTVAGTSRTIADYDMVLFFPIEVGNANNTLAAEAEAIAQFMENGGGFFATGDHANLGGELTALIPRVRSMRRWYFDAAWDEESAPGPNGEAPAPPPLGMHRIDTTRKGKDSIGQFEDQSDEVPQEIYPTYYGAGLTVKGGYPAHKYLPHPLLCSPDGVVCYLPDHMHEGICEVPDNLAARTFMLGGSSVREYPDYTPASPPAGYIPEPLAPEIVAYGKVLPGTVSPALDSEAHVGSADAAAERTFGVIGAWDGHRVNKGRVVVDSTWHHFFDINLTGDRYLEDESLSAAHQQKLFGFYVPDGMGGREAVAEYKMIMWYYRNIVYWLIPKKRMQSIWIKALDGIVRHSQLREELITITKVRDYKRFTFDYYYYFGQLAEAYLSKARGACAIYHIHPFIFKPKIPWWEWIQDLSDIWDPIKKKHIQRDIAEARLLGALGVGPRPDVGITLGLGAAIVSTAIIRTQMKGGEETEEDERLARKIFPEVLEHAHKEYAKALAKGEQFFSKLEKIVGPQERVTA